MQATGVITSAALWHSSLLGAVPLLLLCCESWDAGQRVDRGDWAVETQWVHRAADGQKTGMGFLLHTHTERTFPSFVQNPSDLSRELSLCNLEQETLGYRVGLPCVPVPTLPHAGLAT